MERDAMAPIITLLTDFGMEDTYVASMKGIILGICPETHLVDITHLIPPQDIRAAAFLLGTMYRDFPPGTIHLAVVDPGVGTKRRALALRASDYFFVGPDNGLFSWILRKERDWVAYSLEVPRFRRPTVSGTFHGRDIFAPAAAHLANGTPISDFGPSHTPQIAPWCSVTHAERTLRGQVIHVDHFGNAITNLTRDDLKALAPEDQCIVQVKNLNISALSKTYSDAKPGSVLALIGSSGHLEISINRDHAARILEIEPGDPVLVHHPRAVKTK